MNEFIKQLQAGINANTEISFTLSDIESVTSAASESTQPDRSENAAPRTAYTETRLSNDMVAAMDGWLDNEYLQSISGNVVISHLDEILLLLIAIRSEACGKELSEDIDRLFGAELSPGTVYPHLTGLADEGLLDVTQFPKRKVHRLADPDQVSTTVDPTVNQLVVFSLVLKALAVECTARHSQSQENNPHER